MQQEIKDPLLTWRVSMASAVSAGSARCRASSWIAFRRSEKGPANHSSAVGRCRAGCLIAVHKASEQAARAASACKATIAQLAEVTRLSKSKKWVV